MGANPTVLDDLLKVGDWKEIEIQENITDDDFSFSVDSKKVTEALARMQKEKPIYFTKQVSGPRDVVPSASFDGSKSSKEMTREEIIEKLKAQGSIF